MESILSYVEPHPDIGSEEQVNFKWICPKSFKIAKHQAGTLNNPGLSVVAFIKSEDLNNKIRDFCNDIENYQFFTKIDRLHATLLGVFAGNGDEKGSNEIFEETVYNVAKEYIQGHRPRSINLIIDEIRPGTWRNRNLDNKQVYYCGNGTIFATGPTSGDNKKFCDLGIGLAEYLKGRLDYIFGHNFKRKFPNLSITLGYFNGNDFVICEEVYDIFDKLRYLNLTCKVEKFELVRYYERTLKSSVTIGKEI